MYNIAEKDGIIFIRPDENACGGTTSINDTNASQQIESDDMILFKVKCSFSTVVSPDPDFKPINYFSAFAAPYENGCSFLRLDVNKSPYSSENDIHISGVFKTDIVPDLVKLAREENLAKGNGQEHFTAGLPQNFGGSVNMKFQNGENVYYSNNQSPVISPVTANKIIELINTHSKAPKVRFKDADELVEIRFNEKSNDGGFTQAVLTLNSDGTGTNRKKMKFADPHIYETEKPMEKDTVDFIKGVIKTNEMLAWAKMPTVQPGFSTSEKSITFVFKDEEITVCDHNVIPDELSGGFFKIELEMTTKG